MKGIKYWDTHKCKHVLAYHIEENGYAYNKKKTLVIGVVGLDLVISDGFGGQIKNTKNMKAQSFEKVIPTCPVCGNAMPERSSLEPAVPVEEANDVALKHFPNGMGQDSLFDILQEARREGFIYGANWKEEKKGMQKGFIVQLKQDAATIDADELYQAAFKYAKDLYRFAKAEDIKESTQFQAFKDGVKWHKTQRLPQLTNHD